MKETCKNCIWLLKVNKHPWNKGEGKGSVSESMGYVCAVQLDNQVRDNVIYFDNDFGGCELHTEELYNKFIESYDKKSN
jgi:hypothetical protein